MSEASAQEPAAAGQTLTAAYDGSNKRVVVRLSKRFELDHWAAIEPIKKRHLKAGQVDWSVDLRQLAALDSRLMGLLIGLNAVLAGHQGSLDLLAAGGSSVARSLRDARLGRILKIIEV